MSARQQSRPGPFELTDDDINRAVRTERESLCSFLHELDEPDWETRTLCPDWTVREVVAHLTTTSRTTFVRMMLAMMAARGDFHRMTSNRARRVASLHSPGELVGLLRESAASTRRMPGSAPMDPLLDLLVHGQDIARPVGRDRSVPSAVGAAALSYAATNPFYGPPDLLTGLRLIATDNDWATGNGPHQVYGTTSDLLLIVTGRPAGLAGLSGDGVDELAAALTS